MSALSDRIPNVDDLLVLQPEEIGSIILNILINAESNSSNISNRNNFLSGNLLEEYPRNKHTSVKKVLMEGWSWLESEGLIAPDPDQSGSWVFITRRGYKAVSPDVVNGYRNSNTIKKELLHPRILEKCWAAILRGDYESSVFIAFREVEITVRELSNFPPEYVGTDLMRRAFGGPLKPAGLPKGEQESIGHLFAGAIGWFKNPISHRHVGISELTYAAQALMFASHLLYLAETTQSFNEV